MYRWLVAIMLFAMALLVGCTSDAMIYEPPPKAEVPVQELQPDTPEKVVLEGDWGIHPAKVPVGKFRAGATVETWTNDDPYGYFEKGDPTGIVIHNNRDYPVEFQLTYQLPFSERDGFVQAPSVVKDWVIISNSNPILSPYEARLIPISFSMPDGIKDFPEKWEFQIRVRDLSQTGMFRIEYWQRWLVSMR